MCLYLSWLAQLCPALVLFWNWLKLSVWSAIPGLFPQKPPYLNLDNYIWYTSEENEVLQANHEKVRHILPMVHLMEVLMNAADERKSSTRYILSMHAQMQTEKGPSGSLTSLMKGLFLSFQISLFPLT